MSGQVLEWLDKGDVSAQCFNPSLLKTPNVGKPIGHPVEVS
jgi:hypothetical protein